jgi:hypothetical protein
MTWHELTKQCVESLSHPERSGGMRPAVVLQSKRRGGLFPRGGGPRPKVLGSDSKGYFLWYDAEKVLAALCARGIIKYSSTGSEIKFEILA